MGPRVVITAAHCLDPMFEHPGDFHLQVRYGSGIEASDVEISEIPMRPITSVRPCPRENSGGYAIHSTTEVSRLGRAASHGCVRLAPGHAAKFYALVRSYGAANTRISIAH